MMSPWGPQYMMPVPPHPLPPPCSPRPQLSCTEESDSESSSCEPTAKVLTKLKPKKPDHAPPLPPNAAPNVSIDLTIDKGKKRKYVDMKGGVIEIMTVGWRQQGARPSRNFHDLMEAQGGLLDRLHVRGANEPDILLDCREFKDPNLDKSILNHTGYHCRIVTQTVKHAKFEHVITEAVKEVKLHGKKSNDTFRILCVCTSGVHRSVSFAIVLDYVLKKIGLETTIRHMSAGSWKPRNLCKTCPCCDDNNEKNIAACEKAYRMCKDV